MPQRPLQHFAIIDRRGEPQGMVAPDDLTLHLESLAETAILPAGALAYCADRRHERVLFTLHTPEALAALFAAPFLFSLQLQTALSVVSVPFERLSEVAPGQPQSRPVLIFSPGRTGSTLLTRALGACGLTCASEPDMLTQITTFRREDRLRMGLDMEPALAAACIDALARCLGPAPVIKLRSQCNARPLPLLAAAPGCRVIFMLRGLRDWALSRHLSFEEPAESVAAALRHALDALDKLTGAGVDLKILWFENLISEPAAALRLCVPGIRVNAKRLAAVMAVDAQEGTAVARSALTSRSIAHDFLSGWDAAWAEARAGAMWSDQIEGLLVRMQTMKVDA